MLQFLNQTFAVDTYILVIVGLLSGVCSMLTMQVLSRGLAIVSMPGFMFGALIANCLFEHYAIRPTPDEETNVVVACTLGIILVLLALFILIRVSTAAASYRVARHQFRRVEPGALSRRQSGDEPDLAFKLRKPRFG